MKKLILIIALFCFLFSNAQNVGIGTNTPAEKLDVNGNVNVQGQLKANGNAGSAGQVLAKDASNNLSWMNFNNYPNFTTFDCATSTQTASANNCSSSWTVPAGVTSILVECWGGGGGGCIGSGGGGGGYIVGILPVTPGASVILSIGAGGYYGTDVANGIQGGISSASFGGAVLYAIGGAGGSSVNPTTSVNTTPSFPGIFGSTAVPLNQFIGFTGKSGKATIIDYKQVSTTDFAKVIYSGSGGDAGNAPGSGAKGGYAIISGVSGTLFFSAAENMAPMPGGGGGADQTYGYFGRGGRVIIHW